MDCSWICKLDHGQRTIKSHWRSQDVFSTERPSSESQDACLVRQIEDRSKSTCMTFFYLIFTLIQSHELIYSDRIIIKSSVLIILPVLRRM